ncbi:MAG: glucosaminidase domain-containing protein [Muribaculaceae bacterium]|nr:glucosaminidase domain-containing protein [Muribaculaceae bacterium]
MLKIWLKISLKFLNRFFAPIRLCAVMLSLGILPSYTSAANQYEEYIAKYAEMARQQMKAFNIPASITLAQGLLESSAGKSTLAREGNNHFGIKCHADWQGDTMLRNDDRPDECFRVYDSPEDSFRDHSLFLRRKRYAPLFDLEITDYTGWAKGLRKCGYATDPNYADKLISIIELYSLYNYDSDNMREIEEMANFIHKTLSSRHAVRKMRGSIYYVIAQPGDTYAKIAKELKMSKKKLLAFNDCDSDQEIPAWQEVYLQDKPDCPPAGERSATIGDGETMHSIAQRYGMRLSTLKALNPKAKDKPGTTLRLR